MFVSVNRSVRGNIHYLLGYAFVCQGELDRAWHYYRSQVTYLLDFPGSLSWNVLPALAHFRLALGEMEEAAVYLGLMEEKRPPPPYLPYESMRERLVERLRPSLPPETYQTALERGRNLDLRDVLRRCLADFDQRWSV